MKTLVVFVILSLFLAACSTAPVPAPEPVMNQPVVETQGDSKGVSGGGEAATVMIKNFKFVPAELKIKKGTTVNWRNGDGAAHTIESSDKNNKILNSDELGDADTYTFTFQETGTFAYFCGIHSSMKGTIIVE